MMNEIIQAMKDRRSIRKFRAEMPPKEEIEQIIEAGLYAPSGMNRQGAVILAVTDKELRDRLSAANCKIAGGKEGTDPFYGAPVILVVLSRKDAPTYLYDGSLVLGNMLLAAHSLGLGSIWIHRAKEEFEMEEFQALLSEHGLEGEWEGIGHCAVGYVEGDMPAPLPRKEGRVIRLD